MNNIYGLDFNIKDSKIRFNLHKDAVEKLSTSPYRFGFSESNFGEIVYYRTYSRTKSNGLKELWPDTVIRVINGVMTTRKWWFKIHNLQWIEDDMQKIAYEMADSMLKMHWLPPGRGIQNMGSDYVYERGSLSLYNCFTADTLVMLANGTSVPIKDLVGKEEFYTFSYDLENKKPVIGRGHSARLTKKNAEIYKVTLDNGNSVKCTGDHKWLLNSGEYKEAKNLTINESLMPIYRQRHEYSHCNGYKEIRANNSNYTFEHRLADEYNILNGLDEVKNGFTRHHKDFNPDNNDPTNIKRMTSSEHRFIHSETHSIAMKKLAIEGNHYSQTKEFKKTISNNQKYLASKNVHNMQIATKEGRNPVITQLKEKRHPWQLNAGKSQHVRWHVKREKYSSDCSLCVLAHPMNHKVVSVELCGYEDVYDLTVDKYHNFTVDVDNGKDCSSGVIVHNCAFIKVDDLAEDSAWLMDCLMSGVGVGFEVVNKDFRMYMQNKKRVWNYEIPDSKEGWVESTRDLIRSYRHPNSSIIKFDYSKIRPFGTPIKGFGGTASGPKPLIELHDRIRVFCEEYISGQINSVRLTADIENAIGVCVIAGNVRRSAEIAIGSPTDETFLNLKNYDLNPDRKSYGYMSNNTVRLSERDHFNMIPKITERILDNGEPGIMNLINVQKYGRYGHELPDLATGLNPCAEIPLESTEVCNLSEVFPTRCLSKEEFMIAIKSATMYSSTVSLYPTHSVRTNEVVARNRRIGVSISGISEWIDTYRTNDCVRWLKDAYKVVKDYNVALAKQAGVVPSIRLTTVKPSGSISQLVGVPSGMHFPVFKHAIRRIIVSSSSPIFEKMIRAGYLYEPLIKTVRTDEFKSDEHKVYTKYDKSNKDYTHTEDNESFSFEVPIFTGKAREAKQVSSWEQFSILATLQRDWADNAVSATINFNKDTEANQLNHQLSQFIPVLKSVSIIPHSDKGEYNQMPYEGITEDEYNNKVSKLSKIDWSDLRDIEPIVEEKYCTNDQCQIN